MQEALGTDNVTQLVISAVVIGTEPPSQALLELRIVHNGYLHCRGPDTRLREYVNLQIHDSQRRYLHLAALSELPSVFDTHNSKPHVTNLTADRVRCQEIPCQIDTKVT